MDYTIGARATPGGPTLWIGGLGAGPYSGAGDQLTIFSQQGDLPVSVSPIELRTEEGAIVRCWHQPFQPGDDETVCLLVNGQCRARARSVSLASRSLPLRVLLGSCFNVASTEAAQLATAVHALPPDQLPHLQFLCGDQVYLDRSRWPKLTTASRDRRRILDVYRRTWWSAGGLAPLLQLCPAVFCPDDHDIWNDYLADRAGRRRAWRALALGLLDFVQTSERWQQLDVGPLSFLVVDTRRDRAHGQFMSELNLCRTLEWMRLLRGPGVLVLGQPLLGEPRQWHRVRLGSDLSDFPGQYCRLLRATLGAPHSVVILSGDLHWGRVASIARPDGAAQVVEVLSSPLALKGTWSRRFRPWVEAPRQLDPEFQHALAQTDDEYQIEANHFTLIDFEQKHDGVRMTVTASFTDGTQSRRAQSILPLR